MSLWGRLKAWFERDQTPMTCRICGDATRQTKKVEWSTASITVWVQRCGFCGLSTTEVT